MKNESREHSLLKKEKVIFREYYTICAQVWFKGINESYRHKMSIVSLFQIEEIEIVMPNQHYFTLDMTKMGLTNKDEVRKLQRM